MAVIDAAGLLTDLGQQIGPLAPLANLQSVVASVMRTMGYSTVLALKVTDIDLSPVTSDDVNKIIDCSLYEASERILNNLDAVQLKQLGIDEPVKDFRAAWRMRTDNLLRKVKDRYGYGYGTLAVGSVDFDYQAREGEANLGLEGE